MAQLLYIENDGLFEIRGLTDAESNTVVTGATVQVTLKDTLAQTNIAGASWPMAMPHTVNGIYRVVFQEGLTLTEKQAVTAEVTAVWGAVNGKWYLPLTATKRTG